MSNGYVQACNFDPSTDQQQRMSDMLSAIPANNVTADQDRIRSQIGERMRLRQAASAAAAAAAMKARQQPRGLGHPSNPNSQAITVLQNPNSSARRHPSKSSNGMLGVRQDSRIQKPQQQHIMYNNNTHHHPNSRGSLMALFRSQLDQTVQVQAAQAHHRAMQQQRELRAFQLLLSSMPPPSSTYNPMLLSSQPATALTMGLSQNLFQQQQQARSVNFGGSNFDSVHQLPNNPTSTLTLHEIKTDDGGDQQDGLDLSLRL